MASRIPDNRLLLAGLLVVALITVVIATLVLRGDGEPGTPDARSPEVLEAHVQLESWPADDATSVHLSVDPKRGPVWKRADDAVVLTPQSDALSFESWAVETGAVETGAVETGAVETGAVETGAVETGAVETGEAWTRVVGTGSLGDASASATWTFVRGNPQAHLALEFEGLSSNRLASTIELTEHRLPGHRLPGDPIDRRDDRLVLWQPVAAMECEEGDDPAHFDLRIQQIVALQEGPDVSRWPYPNGASAQLVPVFDVPGDHPDPQLQETSAKTASAWLRRARTLIYGHSNPNDPRYGNGGLLGHGLGGTIAVPARWASHPEVVELARDLKGSHVEIAPRGEAEGSALQTTRFAMASSCRTWVELSKKGVPAAIVGTAEPLDQAPMTSASHLLVNAAPLLATVAPVPLDGQRASLLAHGLDPDALDQVVRQRANLIFSTPFVATRNPLIGAAKEGLLEPERDGHWTVAAELSEALANLELWREATPLLVTSVGAAASRASASRQVLHWWTANGELRVHNPSSKAIAGYSLVVAGAARAELDDTAVSSRQIILDDERQATVLWWDLEPGTHTVQLSDGSDGLVALSPVDWQIDAP